jgi:fatty-acyl-CoA synthase
VVYGVAVPGTEGRAGMAALIVDGRFDLADFRDQVRGRLPRYAWPQFLRLLRGLESTGTFKPRKQDLVLEGFDPERIADPLFVFDVTTESYVPLDRRRCALLCTGMMRL